MIQQLLRRKSIDSALEANGTKDTKLKRVLTVKDLVLFGIASVIGAGIFSTIGQAAFQGGPSVAFLFILTALSCGLSAFCYAEFTARVPVSGSAYTYAYVVFGELVAWIIGCCLVLEYLVSNMVVAVSWSAYFDNLLQAVGLHLPKWMLHSGMEKNIDDILAMAPRIFDIPVVFNLPTLFVIIPITWVCYVGINSTKKSTNIMVYVKMLIIFTVILTGAFYVEPANWSPVFPNGFKGMLSGVSAIFFAYIGFDVISTTAEECKNPQRDLPRGIIYTLIFCTVFYILIAVILTGAVHYSKLEGIADPIAFIFEQANNPYMNYLISLGTVVATTSALIIYQMGQPRIWMIMSRDGMLPRRFSKLHPRYKTPAFGTMLCGWIVGVGALLFPLEFITDVTSIGTLFAFAVVCFGILYLPPAQKKPSFTIPYINSRYLMPSLLLVYLFFSYESLLEAILYFQPSDAILLFFVLTFLFVTYKAIRHALSFVPLLGGLSCLYLMTEIPVHSWVIFIYWLVAGLIIYFFYGYKHSKLNLTKL